MKEPTPMLRRDARRLHNAHSQAQKSAHKNAEYEKLKARAEQVYRERLANWPEVELAADLPVAQHADEIIAAIREHQVVVIAGETGSGKTTQIPKLCLLAGLGRHGQIGCTQPRRIAARSVAQRVAEELHQPLGQAVGYQVRFDDTSNPNGLIKFMTDGILLQETLKDRWLNDYDAIIIDEAHERSLNIDFLLGILKQICARRADLKVIVTSATIDTAQFARHFGGAPVIEVSGRMHPVDLQYRPLDEWDGELLTGVLRVMDEINRDPERGDVLIFLPGEREITACVDALKKRHFPNTEVLPLFASLSAHRQMRVFRPGDKRRVIVSTNIAETSLTVPGIRCVIDSGLARVSRYGHRSKIQGLQVEAVAQDSARQRAGRCGRIGPGVCYRLYSEADFESRPEHSDPEILRTSLASVILQTHVLRLGHISEFPFIDPPEEKMIADGLQLLQELQAIDADERLTADGRLMARMPIDVQLAKLLIDASRRHCLKEMLVIASALAVADPRERPLEAAQAADKAHARHADEDSDFMGFVRLWDYFHAQRKALSNKAFAEQCRREFLSQRKLWEWADVHHQLLRLTRQQKFTLNQAPADYGTIHKSLLAGFIGHLGAQRKGAEYQGCRNRKFMIFPGSVLFKQSPGWVVSAALVHTSQVYARTVARVELSWVLEVAAHVLKHSLFDPFWSKSRGTVMGYRRTVLFGLVLIEKERVHYGPSDPAGARDLFIRDGLVAGMVKTRAPFYAHNRALIEQVHREEERHRKHDLLVDEDTLFEWYDARIPADIYSEPALRRWLHKVGADALKMQLPELYRAQASGPDVVQFPDALTVRQMHVPLSYRFQPGAEDDGVTAHLTLAWLNGLKANDFAFLVPGLLDEKITALIKAQPKSLRRQLIPLSDCVARLRARLDPAQPFARQLARAVEEMTGVNTPPAAWEQVELPAHLQFRFAVCDDDGRLQAEGRDFDAIQARLASRANRRFQDLAGREFHIDGAHDWVFGELPERIELDNGLPAFPGLTDQGDAVGLRLFESAAQAASEHTAGVLLLMRLKYPKVIKNARRAGALGLDVEMIWRQLNAQGSLLDELLQARLLKSIDAAAPRSQADFDRLVQRLSSTLYGEVHSWSEALNPVIKEWHAVWQLCEARAPELSEATHADVLQQLDYLVFSGFLHCVELEQLAHYPRYLEAMRLRVESALHSPQKETEKRREVARVAEPFYRLCEQREYDRTLHAFNVLLEEYRVSVFAQRLGTRQKVSAKRVQQAFEALK